MEEAIKTYKSLSEYLSSTARSEFKAKLSDCSYFQISNTGRRGDVKWFSLGLNELKQTLIDIKSNIDEFSKHRSYEEKAWRDLGENKFKNESAKSLIQVQTKPFYSILSKIISWANSGDYSDGSPMNITSESITKAIDELTKISTGLSVEFIEKYGNTPLPSLSSSAGISFSQQSINQFKAHIKSIGYAFD